MKNSSIQRRHLLRAAGASISLPYFASLPSTQASSRTTEPKHRMVCIGNMLGFYPEAFWPPTMLPKSPAGFAETKAFQFGRTTGPLDRVREHVTVLSGLDHGIKGGHFSIHALLSGVKQNDAKTMPMANVTVDQYAAEFVSGQTRFPTLTIGSESGIHGGCQLSWTRSGTRVPPIPGPQQLFTELFVGTKPQDKAAQKQRFELQGSILDFVRGGAADLKRKLNRSDQAKLDEYMTSVREVEQRLGRRREWVDIPKPESPFEPPKNQNMVDDLPVLYDLIALALQTDSTRIATLEIGGDFNPQDLGVRGGYHAFSHHGQQPDAIEALVTLETYQVEHFARFIEKLSSTEDEHGTLLDQTQVLFGSGMGNANSHTNSNLPLVLAGGGLEGKGHRHGRLLAFDETSSHRPPLTNLFVSMLQQFGVETDEFATSTGTLRGLV
ncbi:hypothetical protein Pla22_28550 [Rubripirellula amarantea]|uniref:DUF1552 domain-containing protein n=1 Tax=Rubripirellula amarantea TaxID=2527999 RepID=A0A5C5WXA5_9BACT|nr:DUF1552 domain-containing protein [Rubripirellula amarantea]TWT55200.1 hypothetical protein Pla22_28550 [Rubripirellula amarantea]